MKAVDSISLIFLAALLVLSSSSAAREALPQGWGLGNPESYEAGIDREISREGGASAYLKSKTTSPRDFGTIYQTFSGRKYAGKRVQMSAYVKAEYVAEWAGLWMRVDGPTQEEMNLAFDNMYDRPIKGTEDWKEYKIVLEVPEEAALITFGILLDGPGTVWVDDFSFKEVSRWTPVTGKSGKIKREPRNLGFED